ncbi:MFS transporter [Thioclava pacifica]
MGFVSANLPQLAGDLHATTVHAYWVMAAFLAPRASMPVMLIKIRDQFGLRRFAEIGISAFVVVMVLSLWVDDLHSAVVVAFLSGCAAAPLSSLAFLYMIEAVPPAWRAKLAISSVLTMIMLGRPLARVLLPELTAEASWHAVSLFETGLALICLALIFKLPLTPRPLQKVLAPLDFLSFGLIALGFGGFTASFTFGALYYWTQARWLGLVLAGSIALLTLAVVIELQRRDPLVDFHWLLSPPILHLAGTLLVFRIALSEQSAGAVGLLRTLGMQPDQEQLLFAIVVLAMLAAGAVCMGFNSPARAPAFHIVALVMIALGAWMDSHATALTRPEQMYLSQGMIGFASILFLPPAMAKGLGAAFAKGPNYLLSFIVLFLATQSLGGVIGSGLFRSVVVAQSALHASELAPQIAPGNLALAPTLSATAAAYAPQISDVAQRSAVALSSVANTVQLQAQVLAYDDAFRLVVWFALAALALLLGHIALQWARTRPAPSSLSPVSAQ